MSDTNAPTEAGNDARVVSSGSGGRPGDAGGGGAAGDSVHGSDRALVLHDLPAAWAKQDIEVFFNTAGYVLERVTHFPRKALALVTLPTHELAAEAVEKLHGQKPAGAAEPISVAFTERKAVSNASRVGLTKKRNRGAGGGGGGGGGGAERDAAQPAHPPLPPGPAPTGAQAPTPAATAEDGGKAAAEVAAAAPVPEAPVVEEKKEDALLDAVAAPANVEAEDLPGIPVAKRAKKDRGAKKKKKEVLLDFIDEP